MICLAVGQGVSSVLGVPARMHTIMRDEHGELGVRVLMELLFKDCTDPLSSTPERAVFTTCMNTQCCQTFMNCIYIVQKDASSSPTSYASVGH